MSKKPNKHRPAKPAPPPSVEYSSSKLRAKFIQASDKSWYWEIWRGGNNLAGSSESYVKKDKMKRTFLRLMESVARKQWTLDEGKSKLKV